MNHKLLLSLMLTASVAVNAFGQIKVEKDIADAMASVNPDDIKASITYLADDKLKGRQPGTEGYKMAGDYVIARLKAYGVQPAGENGGWLQQVRLRKVFSGKDSHVMIKSGNKADTLNWREAAIYPNPVQTDVNLNASVVFAGFGITEGSAGYDDYTGLNVKGKVVLVVRGAPDSFSSSVKAHSMDIGTIQKNAAAHGAVAVFLVPTDSTLRVPNFSRGVYSVLDDKGGVAVSRTYNSKISMLGAIDYGAINRLMTNAGKNYQTVLADLKAGKPQSFDLNIQIQARNQSAYQDVNSFNVVGKITGSDPKLKNEYVVHSAHLDHVGIGTPVQGDSIYNGAHDNASGVSSLLQIAKIYSGVKTKPKRSVLIVMVTGEELGLLGSGYFANHPTVPVKNIVADVNTDMPTIIAPLLSVTALGAEHSSLAKKVDEAAGYFGLSVEPDPEPKENRFVRSDQYSFVSKGIPALHIKYGSKTADGKNNLNEIVAVWRAKYYHKPQDDINGTFDFEAGKKYAQLNFLIGYLVANDPVRPVWNKGDIFEKH